MVPTVPSPDADATTDNKPQRTTLLAFTTSTVVLVLWVIGASLSAGGAVYPRYALSTIAVNVGACGAIICVLLVPSWRLR